MDDIAVSVVMCEGLKDDRPMNIDRRQPHLKFSYCVI